MKPTHTQLSRIVVANWKMNPITQSDAVRLVRAIVKATGRTRTRVVIAPPFPHVPAVRAVLPKAYGLGAQDGHEKDTGPMTGAVSLRSLYSYGVRTVILGHSERRAEGESDTRVNAKVKVALMLGMTPVVCVGERERDVHGKYFEYVERQLHAALLSVKRTDM
jgi:triosephosphate isomerase (TIM)